MEKRIKKYDILFIILFLITLSFLVFKSKYGYIYNDEPYLLSLGYRFALGDAMLVDEWSIMQLVGFLIYPFMKVFTILKGDTNRIAMFGRYCFILLWSMSVIYSYICLRKYKFWAAISLMSFYLFAPLDMMTLSYNSFGLIGLLCFSSTIIGAKNEKHYILAGLFLAIAVICKPFIVSVYILFSILALINIKLKKIYLPNNISISKAWIYLSIGCSILFIMFVSFILSRASISTVIDSIKYIIASDAEYTAINIYGLTIKYFREFNLKFKFILFFFPILTIIILIDKERYKRRDIYTFLSVILLYVSFKSVLDKIEVYPNLNLTVIPLMVVGMTSFILTKDKDYDIFIFFIVFGIIYSFIFNLSSNLGLPAIGIPYSLVTVGSILLIGNLIDELQFKDITTYILLLSIFIQFYYQGTIRYERYYLDGSIEYLTDKIEIGPAKGIITNETYCGMYSWQYEQLQMILYDATSEDVFYYPYSNPWYYFATNMQIGTYSTWGSWGNPIKTHELNKEYFKQKPYKYPTYVLLDRKNEIQLTEFIDELISKGYEKRETDDFILYFK